MGRKFTLPSTQGQIGRALIVGPQENTEWGVVSSISISRRFPETGFAADRTAADTLRDNYYTANPSELVDNVYIILAFNNGTENIGDLQVYFDGIWNDQVGTISNTELLNNVDNGFIPLRDNTGLVNSALQETSTEIISTKSIQTPDGTLNIGNWGVSNAASTLVFTDTARDATFFPVASQLTAQGQSNPVDVGLGPISTTPSVANKSETFTGPNIQFRIINSNTGQADQYTLDSTTAVTDCNIIIRTSSHSNPIPSFDWKRATGGTGFDLSVGENALTLPVPIGFLQGVELFVTIEAGDSQTLSLRGQTLDVGGTNETVPYVEVEGRIGTLREYTPRDDSANNLNTTLSSQEIITRDDSLQNQINVIANSGFNSGRAFNIFNDGFIIDDTNINTYVNKNNIYAAKNDKVVDVFMPSDADITAAGLVYPVTFEFTHLAGSGRIPGNNLLRLVIADGNPSLIIDSVGVLRKDEVAIVTKTGVGVNWSFVSNLLDPNATLLPSGVFDLQEQTVIENIVNIQTELSGMNIVAGYAYLVNTGGTWFGADIRNLDVIVSTVNSPSLISTSDDWLIIRNTNNNPISTDSLLFLNQVVRDGTRFDISRNVFVNESNVIEFSSIANGSDLNTTRAYFTANLPGSNPNRTFTYANQNIQFTDLVGGKLVLMLNLSINSVSGFLPILTDINFDFGSGNSFTFPLTGIAPDAGIIRVEIDLPNIDYSAYLNTNCTITFNYSFTGDTVVGLFSVLGLTNTRVGSLNESITNIARNEAMTVEQRVQTQLNALKGDVDEADGSIEALLPRVSPYRNNFLQEPDINARYLDSTGSDAFPSPLSALNQVNANNPVFSPTGTALFIAVIGGSTNYILKNNTTGAELSIDDSEPNVDLGESLNENGVVYFVYRITGLTATDVYEVEKLTATQVVAWQDDINGLNSAVERINAELEHALLNLSDEVIQVFENEVSVTEETTPVIVSTEYNRSFSTNNTQTIFYETNPNTPSGQILNSKPIKDTAGARARRKFAYLPSTVAHNNGNILSANDDNGTVTPLIEYLNGVFNARVFVPANPGGSTTVTVIPTPSNQVARDWYSLPLHTSDLHAEADEIFFTRNVPTAPTTLNVRYRYDANGGHGADQTTTLAITDINQDTSTNVTLSLPDGGSVSVGISWIASQRSIRVTGVPLASNPNFFIFDMEVGVTFDETRTTPATPATTRTVRIENQAIAGQDNIFAIKPSSTNTLILVGDEIEIDTGYLYTTLFGANENGFLVLNADGGVYLDYQNFNPSASSITDLESHATLPQFGLFTTEYSNGTTLHIDTAVDVGGAMTVGSFTTAQRNTITPVDGMIIYNTDDKMFNFREDGAWVTK